MVLPRGTMSEAFCPHCGTVLLPDTRICPFCRLPITPAPAPPLAPSPAGAPEPEIAPSPPEVCASCRVPLGVPRRVPIPQVASDPILWDAYICPRCGRIELYEPRD